MKKYYKIVFPVWNEKKMAWEDHSIGECLPGIEEDYGILGFDSETGYEEMMAIAISKIARAVEYGDRFARVQWTGGGKVNHPMATFAIWDDDPDHYGWPEDRFFRIILKRV